MTNATSENSKQGKPALRALFPDLTEEQFGEVEETLHGYLEVAWQIYQRLERERPEGFDRLQPPS
jgi:hypothetical protein